ncbi:MAG: autotransporter strand-loop-strand O-heptosyltransferase [Selenomonadaceae bacterium]|nr:autotransporter strand-loop-strand O-heptosyltransferase [Selenomonadaceae bacterium]
MATLMALDQAIGLVLGETDVPGLRIDFNGGLRLQIPTGNWRVIIGDYDSGEIYFDDNVAERVLISWEKYYVRWQVEVYLDDERVLAHVVDLKGQKVHLICNTARLGDTLTFLPYVKAMRDFYRAEVTYWTFPQYRELAAHLLPQSPLADAPPEDSYATYYLSAVVELPGLSPFDIRTVPMTQWGQIMLGLPKPAELIWQRHPKKPRTKSAKKSGQNPYVCIAVQASSVLKGWLYPGGWEAVTDYLRQKGYRVLCIDKDREQSAAGVTIRCPEKAEDCTGDISLVERLRLLSQAEFFVGLSSGLAWLANIAGCPVVMIAGFTRPWFEFPTPYRVYNRLVCNGCLNDLRSERHNTVCPRFAPDSEHYLECCAKISPGMVIEAIERLLRSR